jgi:hypothetical protein
LNSGAAIFVSAFGASASVPASDHTRSEPQTLRESIRTIKNALEQWEAAHLQEQQLSNNEAQDLIEVLTKLTPEETAVVKNMLESKEMQKKPAKQTLQLSTMCPEPFYPGMMQSFEDSSAAMGMWSHDFMAIPGTDVWQAGGWNGASKAPFKPFAPSKAKQSKQTISNDAESLATHLHDLAQLEGDRVLMVRKINHIQGDPAAALKAYFSKFGTVERVMMSATRSTTKPTRLRPATIGFLVMDTYDAVQAALAAGPDHVVADVTIITSTFKSHPVEEGQKLD